MRDGWETVPVERFATQRIEPLALRDDETYVNLGVKWYAQGTFQRAPKLGAEIKAPRLFRVRPGQFIYNRMFATEGSFALVQLQDERAVASNEFPVFDLDESQVLGRYLALHFQQPTVWRQVSQQCVGTTKSRLRWKEERFLKHRIQLPPLPEQERIVDLVAALDNAIESNSVAQKAAESVLSHVRAVAPAHKRVPLGDIATMRSGPSWKAADESPKPGPGLHPVLGITNTPTGRRLKLDDQRFVKGVPGTAQRLDESSLVMIRTNGNRSRIGNIYRATPEVHGFAVSAFQIALQPRHSADAPFLYWYLGSAEVQKSISDAASGSTGLGNIAVGWLKKVLIPSMEEADRTQYIATCEAAGTVQDAMVTVGEALLLLRSNLLTALLSGAHPIPDSYDSLIEEAA